MLILGASGKVGRLLSAFWRRFPPTARPLPVMQSRHAGPGLLRWQPGADPAVLGRPQSIVVLWGVTAGSADALAANTQLALEAIALARALHARRVLLASSAAVYGPGDGLGEAAPLAPGSAYGRAKQAMEEAVLAQARAEPGPDICLMRLANVIGADSLADSLARHGGQAEVTLDRFASGHGPVRAYISPGDLARALSALAVCPAAQLPEVVNVCGDAPLSMAALARAAGAQINWREAPAGAVERVTMQNDRLRALTGPLTVSADAGAAMAELAELGVAFAKGAEARLK